MAETGCLRDNVAVQNLEVLGQATIAGTIEKPSSGGILTPADLVAVHNGAAGAAAPFSLLSPANIKLHEAYNNLPPCPAAGAAITQDYANRVNQTFGTSLVAGAVIATGNGNAATAAQVKRLDCGGAANVATDQIDDGALPSNQFQVYLLEGDCAANNTTITLPAAAVGNSLLFLFASDFVFPDNGNTIRIIANGGAAADASSGMRVNGRLHLASSSIVSKGDAAHHTWIFTPAADNLAIDNAAGDGSSAFNGFITCTCSTTQQWHVAGCFGDVLAKAVVTTA